MSEYIVEIDGQMPDAIYERELTEIVRCRDCTNYATDELGDYCTLMDFEDVVGMADKFCAWGERKGDAE